MILGVHGIIASSGGVSFDADYQAILNYATTQGYTLPSASQQTMQNQLVVDLKAAGVWSKLDTFAVFATDGDSDFALIDWINLSQYTAYNSPTFTANQGFEGNNITSYIDSNYNALSGTNWSQDNASFGYYMWQVRISSPSAAHNAFGTGSNNTAFIRPTSPVRLYLNNTNVVTSNTYTWDAIQFTHATRVDSSNLKIYVDGTLNSTLSTSSTTPTSDSFFCFKNATSNYTDCGLSMVFAGASLAAEDSDLYNAWNNYYTSL